MIRRTLLVASGVIAFALPALAEPTTYTLQAAIQRAIATHPDAITAQSLADAAGLAIADAQSQRLQLAANASALARHTAVNGATQDQTPVNGSVALTVPLFTGLKLTNNVRAAEENRDSLASQAAATRADLAFQVTNTFWTLRRAQLVEEVQKATIEQAQHTLALTRTGYELGRQAANEVDHAEVSVLNSQGDLLQGQSQTHEARIQLATLLAVPERTLEIDPGSEALSAALDTPSPAEVDRAIGDRPEIKAATQRLAAADASVAAAGGDRWPQLSFITSYQYGNNPYDPTSGASFLAQNYQGIWDARLAATFNLFDGGRVYRAIARAEQDRVQAAAALEKIRRNVRQQVEVALAHWQSAHDRRALAEKSTAIAAKTLTWMQTRYQQGYSPQVDVLTAQSNWYTARMQRVGAFVDEQLARAELARALGKL